MHPTDVTSARRQLDRRIDRWRGEHPATVLHCRAGCGNCCRLAVHATLPEAAAVAGELREDLGESLDRHVQRLLTTAIGVQDWRTYLRRYRQELGACPFLSATAHCRIHAERPLACRALLATRPGDWCGIDLAELDSWDRQLFEQSLDRGVVAWPTHYVAETQDAGRRLENALLDAMRQRQGWSLAGNFTLLVWLERQWRISSLEGPKVAGLLGTLGLGRSPLLALTLATPAER